MNGGPVCNRGAAIPYTHAVASPEPSLSAAHEPPPEEEGYDAVDDFGSGSGASGGNGATHLPPPPRSSRSTRPRRLDGANRSVTAPRRDDGVDELVDEFDGVQEADLVDDQYDRAVVEGSATASVRTIE